MTTRLIEKYQIWSGRAIEININGDYPANVLSNQSDNAFLFDGLACGSMEGFLQSLHEADPVIQRRICIMGGKPARNFAMAKRTRKENGKGNDSESRLWWKGNELQPGGTEFNRIIDRAFHTMFFQNEEFQTALLATAGKKLYHTKDASQKLEIISERQFLNTLYNMREHSHEFFVEIYRRRDTFLNFAAKKLVDDAISLVSGLVGKENSQEPVIASVNADPEAFSTLFTFSIMASPAVLKFNGEGNDDKWLVEVDVSNGINKYECPLGFGTIDRILKRLQSDGCVDHVRLALVDGLSSPYIQPS